MRKPLPVPLIIGVLVVVVLIVIGFTASSLAKPPGPDATHYRPPTQEELIRDHATPPPGLHRK